jgi:hypothetical protein
VAYQYVSTKIQGIRSEKNHTPLTPPKELQTSHFIVYSTNVTFLFSGTEPSFKLWGIERDINRKQDLAAVRRVEREEKLIKPVAKMY